ncbi:hypothetical protein OESDEN_22808 [Oesophagostomum dentatum]|uniref:Uncharacterized protein n=1 Tax=Oesophagostomum dentatum TaxID=61180 RepID=A0A0B1S278_OESDE|nr:hypothetical protein OESDEN_22808 [Oesophagostomum dentatum]
MMNFFNQRKNGGGEPSRSGSSSSKSGSRSPDSVERNRLSKGGDAKTEEGDDVHGDTDSNAHGPTTRNRWKVYVNQCEEKKKRVSAFVLGSTATRYFHSCKRRNDGEWFRRQQVVPDYVYF